MSTIQFNLLPDVKAHYMNTQRNRRTIIAVSLITTAISIGIFILVFFSVDVVQKQQLKSASSQATKASNQLNNIKGLSKIVTIQNQLQTLSSLHQSKHAVSRIFTYIPQLTPATASISSLSLDTTGNQIQISGTADSQATINTFVDTLKYATYKTSDQDTEHQAFPTVTLNSFDITPGRATYSITAIFDPNLFTNPLQAAPTMIVKNQVTTRSVIDDPSNALFNGQTGTKTGTAK